jgi:hypothetical protein
MKLLTHLFACSLFASLLSSATQAAITPLLNHGDVWSYHKGTNAPQTDWKTSADASLNPDHWLTGLGGFGYGETAQETSDCKTILTDMRGTAATNYSTLYLRKTFTITNALASDLHLLLRVDFDDGYIAWLDGNHLTNRFVTGAPTEPLSSALANASHECSTGNSSPQPAETNDLGHGSARLGVGDHVLAIIGLNNNKSTSGDFVQVADLYLDLVSNTPPVIAAQPQSQTVTVGSNATFSVTASGTTPFGYQWLFNRTNAIANASTATLVLANVQFTNAGGYSVVVTNVAGSATSAVATLFVNPPPLITNGVGGLMAIDTTWYATNRFYTVTSSITVLSNVTLTIEPGVTVWSRRGCGITVYGRLLADGTTDQPITFTRYPTDLNWERILFVKAADSRFRNCFFEYANCAGDHKTAYYATNCAYPMAVAPRTYFEAVVALACHLDFEDCVFRNLFDAGGTSPVGDAIGIFSDDLVYRGPASANVRGCQFLYIGQGVNTRYAYVLVENCYFVGKTGDNDDVELYGESSLYGLPSPLVRNNLFDIPAYDDRVHPTRCSAIIHDNVFLGSSDHVIVLRDTCCPIVFNNVLQVIDARYNCPNGGISIQNGCDALIVNNTIIGIDKAIKLFDHQGRIGLPYCLSAASGRATVINCLIWNGTRTVDVSGESGAAFQEFRVDISYSDLQGGTNSFYYGSNQKYRIDVGPGILNADPLFVSAGSRNYRVNSNSPCIDAGTTNLGVIVTTNTYFVGTSRLPYAVTNDLSTIVTDDFDGIPRPLDGHGDGTARFDIGAYECLLPSADSNGDGIPDGWCWQYGFSPLDPSVATADANGDGIPNGWCWRYGLNPTDPNVASGNPDGDPHTTFQEWMADTDPTNALSYLRIAAISNGPPATVHFLSSSNRQYTLFATTNLVGSNTLGAVPGQTAVPGTGRAQVLSDTTAAPQKFYRIGASVP